VGILTGLIDGLQGGAMSVRGKLTTFVALVATTAAALSGIAHAGVPPAQEPNGTPIVIGNVGTTSGPLGASFGVMQEGVQAWVDYVNDHGGINGRPVRLVTGDDSADPAKFLAAVQQMVQQDGVIAFVGVPAGTTVQAGAAYLGQQQVPIVGGVLGNFAWDSTPVYFPQGVGPSRQVQVIAENIAAVAKAEKQKNAKVAVVRLPVASARQVVELWRGSGGQPGVLEQLGLEFAADIEVQQGQADYTAACIALRDSDAQYALLQMDENTIARLTQSCSRQQLETTYVTSPSITSDSVVELAAGTMEGAVGVSLLAPWTGDQKDVKLFRKQMKKVDPDANPTVALQGWASGRIFEAAMEKLPKSSTSSTELMTQLRSLTGETLGGLTGPLGFGKTAADPNPGSTCWWPLQVKDETWGAIPRVGNKAGQVCLPKS
jgi:branched-chain amino acid transport system substrate-binding protein